MSKVFVPVFAKDELPENGVLVGVMLIDGIMSSDHIVNDKPVGHWWWNRHDREDVLYWLKEVELPNEVTVKLSVVNSNPFRDQHSWNAWNMGLVRGIKAVFNLINKTT